MNKNTNLILEALDIAVRQYCQASNVFVNTVGEKKADQLRNKAWEFEAIADAISNGTIKVEEVKNEK